MITGDCRPTIRQTVTKISKSGWKPSRTPSVALVVTTVVSTFVVALAAGSGRLGVYNISAGIDNDSPRLLRRGNSEALSGITLSGTDPDSSPFLPSGVARRSVQRTIVEDNNITDADADADADDDTILCDLEYCQTTFEENIICQTGEEEKSYLASIPVAVQVLMLLVLLSFSALFSGLTLGLMSLDITGLEIVMAGDDPDAAKYAERIYPLRKQGNLLLCTLLLGNVAVNSLMSIFSAAIFDGTIGFLSSTFAIVIFGEIIPQALVGFIVYYAPCYLSGEQ
jgi:hypothetical protein